MAMDAGSPFAAFLAAREAAVDRQPSPTKAGAFLGKAFQPASPGAWMTVGPATALAGPHDGPRYDADPADDPFYTFLAQRPKHPTQETEALKMEVFKTKLELLSLAADVERRAAEGDAGLPEDAARARRLRVAQRYLDNPQLIGQAFSHTPSAASEDCGRPASSGRMLSTAGGSRASRVSVGSAPAAAEGDSKASGLAASASAPTLGSVAAVAAAAVGRLGTSQSQRSRASDAGSAFRATGTLALSGTVKPPRDVEGWYTKTRCFNVMVSKQDHSVHRGGFATPGGNFVLGAGKVQYFTGSHIMTKGYFYSFRVDRVDEAPPEGARPGFSLAFGLSPVPPTDPSLKGKACPLYAYEIPGVSLVGYGDTIVEEGRWHRASWGSGALAVGDRVGVLLTHDSDMVVYVNDEQVLRYATQLVAGPKTTAKKALYPIVDLVGPVSAVTLLPLREPPPVPLRSRQALERK